MKTLKALLTACCFTLLLAGCEKDEEQPKNLPPVVNAGSDISAALKGTTPESITLSGTAKDAEGTVVGYIWSQLSGPNAATITTPAAATTTVTGIVTGTYEFQLMATDNEGASGVDVVKVTLTPAPIRTLTLQPNGDEGQDAVVFTRQGDGGDNANRNQSFLTEISMSQWTYNAYGWGEGTNRTFIKFTGLSAIPAGATIRSAKLSLYGPSQAEGSQISPQGNTSYPGSTASENSCWIKRVTGGNWDESTITWNNMPATTDANRVAIPASTTRWDYNMIDLDVTQLVKDIQSSGQNYGFCLQLQNEQIYRNLGFMGSETTNAAKRPKLVVEYQ